MKFALAFLATVVVAHSASVSHHGSLREHVPQDAPQNAPAISTTSGKVIGHKAIWPANSGAEEYLGIPYAAPPIRELRFMAPKPFQANGTIKADDFMDACMQPVRGADAVLPMAGPTVGSFGVGMGGIPGRKYSEDCLGLNIWTKPGNATPKAVLVWIHGGAFASGDTAAPFYNGARLAAQEDVIVVSVGYRVGLFGFPGAPGLSDHNLSLLDMRAAVVWLRDNIEKFGGDPKRITLFGQSSGAVSIDYYAYAWAKDPIVAGLISQSGSAFIGIGYPEVNSRWFSASKKLGCGGIEAGEKTVECMQRIPADLLVSGFGTGLTGFITMFGGFGPIVDDKVVFDNYHARAAAGMIAQVPYLGGHTDREAGIVSAITFAVMKGLAEGDGLLAGVAGTIKGALDSLRYSSAVETVGNYLGPLLSGAVGCAMRDAMDARYNSKVPVWRYLYQAAFPNTELYPDTGAYHGIDVPAVFGTTERSLRKIKDTPEEAKFVQNIMHAWATFAKDPERGLDGIGWKQYHPKGQTLVRLGHQNKAELAFASNQELDSICPTVSRVGTLTGISSGL